MTGLRYDKDATERLLALYVTPDVVAQRDQFLFAFNVRPGERVLDVGSGPGFLAAAMADAVGPSGRVFGVDISEPLLAVARSHCTRRPAAEFRYADAAHLPFPDHSFDAVVSTQVLEYVRDVDAALAEFRRVLRPGGRVGIMDTDWDSLVWHCPDLERAKRVLSAWDDHATDPYLPRTLAYRLRRAGFSVVSQQVMTLFNPDYDVNTYSNRLIDLIVAFVAERGKVTRDDAETWGREVRQLGERALYFFSLNRYVFLAECPGPGGGHGSSR